jgi:hypothetical protein
MTNDGAWVTNVGIGALFAQRLEPELLRQIAPPWIDLLDQSQFPGAVPFFDTLLADDRVFHRRVLFKPDQHLHVVLAGEAVKGSFSVLGDALEQVRGDANAGRFCGTPKGTRKDRIRAASPGT